MTGPMITMVPSSFVPSLVIHARLRLCLTVLYTQRPPPSPGSQNTCELLSFSFTEALEGLMHTFEIRLFLWHSLTFLLHPPLRSWQPLFSLSLRRLDCCGFPTLFPVPCGGKNQYCKLLFSSCFH